MVLTGGARLTIAGELREDRDLGPVLVGLAVVADRVGVGIAEDRVGEQLAANGGLAGTPDVDITGFPFLTQAVAGDVRRRPHPLTAEELGQPEGTRADVALQGVHVPLSARCPARWTQIPVDRVDGTATLSYALLAAQLGGDTTLGPEGDGIRLTKSVEVLGFDYPGDGVGHGRPRRAGPVWSSTSRSVGRRGRRPGLRARHRRATCSTSRYRVPALPFGLQLTSVAAGRRRRRRAGRGRGHGAVGLREYRRPNRSGCRRRGRDGIGAIVLAAALAGHGRRAWWLRTRNGGVPRRRGPREAVVGEPAVLDRAGRPTGGRRPHRRAVLHRLLRPVPLHPKARLAAAADHPAGPGLPARGRREPPRRRACAGRPAHADAVLRRTARAAARPQQRGSPRRTS